jgi:DNA-binding GntR family transcriptional regulator
MPRPKAGTGTKGLKSGASALFSSRSKNICDLVGRALREGRWLPGDRIDDLELARELEVSRISVREALSSLVERRIVEKVHYKGYFVRKFNLEEIESIVEARVALEELAVRRLLERRPAEIFTEMERSIAISARLSATDSHSEYMDADFRFHELLYEGSGNVWIKNIISDMRDHISIIRNISMKIGFDQASHDSTSDHRKILKQLVRGNEANAIRLLRGHFSTHLKNIRASYTSAMASRGNMCVNTEGCDG